MSLKETISKRKIEAMKARNKELNSTLILVVSAINQYEVDTRTVATDEVVVEILNKLVKQRQEAAKEYKKANRLEQAEKELAEMVVIQEFLPNKQLSEDEIDSIIKRVIAEKEATSMKDIGKVMPVLKAEMEGRADISVVSDKVKKMLS